MLQLGTCYARRMQSGKAVVARLIEIGEWVEYEMLHGPKKTLRNGRGRCKRHNFERNWQPVEEQSDYSNLDGAVLLATYIVLDTHGTPILRCSQKRAEFYIRREFVKIIDDATLQFTDSQTEDRLKELYLGEFSQFFLAVKNDRCVCCGTSINLTRHHVVPKRHKHKIPTMWRGCVSNVLFVCSACHRRYEEIPEPNPEYHGDWQEYAQRWKNHFIATMTPNAMPEGWDIISVRNLKNREEHGQPE